MATATLRETWEQWKARDQQIRRLFDDKTLESDPYREWKLGEFRKINQVFSRLPVQAHDIPVQLVRGEILALEKQLYPNRVARVLQRFAHVLKDAIVTQWLLWKAHRTKKVARVAAPIIVNKQQQDMNENNLNALKDNLKNLGFGEDLNAQLELNIRGQQPEFTLKKDMVYNKTPMQTELSFRKGDQNEMYFFNKYEAKLTETTDRQQTFYIDKGRGVTTKEAFNLLEGRAVNKNLVNKEGEQYNAWLQLDLSQKDDKGNFKLNRYTTNYGYNLENAVAKYPLKELLDPQTKADLLQSLQKGNRQSVTMEKEENNARFFMEANPKMKTINLYDQQGQLLSKELKKDWQVKVSATGTAQTPSPKAGAADEVEGPELKKKRTQAKGVKL